MCLRDRRTATGDVLTVAMLRGQTLAQWVACADRLAQAFDAPVCRVTAVPGRPQRLLLSFPTRDALGVVVAPLPPVPLDALDLEAVPVARAEDGTTYAMPVLYAHTLVAGETGAGKGSVLWSVLAGLGPAIQMCIRDRYEALMDARSLTRHAGGVEVAAEQAERLLKVMKEPNVRLSVLPETHDARALALSPFALYDFHDPEVPPLVLVETTFVDVFHTSGDDVAAFERLWHDLSATALSAKETRAWLQAVRDGEG